MKTHFLAERSLDFSVDIVKLCDGIERHGVLKNQLLRSATSIGANIHEEVYASSGGDFVNKYQISLKECHETEYWLKIMVRTGIITEEIFANLQQQCGSIRRMLISSIRTAKGS